MAANDGVVLHVDVKAAGAIEQSVDPVADGALELRLVEALRLRLPGHDQARAVGARRLQRLAREEHDRGLHDGEHHRQKRRGDHARIRPWWRRPADG